MNNDKNIPRCGEVYIPDGCNIEEVFTIVASPVQDFMKEYPNHTMIITGQFAQLLENKMGMIPSYSCDICNMKYNEFEWDKDESETDENDDDPVFSSLFDSK